MSRTIRTHIVLLCVTTVYLSTVEGLNIIIKDVSNLDLDGGADTIMLKLLKQSNSVPVGYRQKRNELVTLDKILEKINNNEKLEKGDLRGSEMSTVQNFLLKLNNFINQNTNNYYYAKRGDCKFGFGRPGSHCKTNTYRRLANQKEKNDKLNYAQHMLIERAKSGSSSESDSDDDKPKEKKKSRFQIVNNGKKNKGRQKESSEDDDYDDIAIEEENSDDSDESSEPKQVIKEDVASDEPRKELSDDSDEKSEETKDKNENFLYLQGTRLQNPYFRSGPQKVDRRGFRMAHFMPKRFKWDDNMLTHLDEYWTQGIRSYDTYRHKYYKYLPVYV